MRATPRSTISRPAAERLLSYALDLDTEVAPGAVEKPEELLSVRHCERYANRHAEAIGNIGVHDQKLGRQGKDRFGRAADLSGCTLVAPKIRRKRPATAIVLP